ncbi:MAG: hypothetical protein KF723_22060 [Rhizobiaceae bacterium]|nr:hypothetical protein [Rhizobiaceae bacterium]
MTIFYKVHVERTDRGFCDHCMVAAASPILAAEAAERIIAERLVGDGWSRIVHEFFAYHVAELTAADFMKA